VSYLLFTGACSRGVRGMDFFHRELGGIGKSTVIMDLHKDNCHVVDPPSTGYSI